MNEFQKLVAELLQELDKMTEEEIVEFFGDWKAEMVDNNRIVTKFAEMVIDVAINRARNRKQVA